MKREPNISISDADREAICADHIAAREEELAYYEANIETYEMMLADEDTPPEVRKQVEALLKTERFEHSKVAAICRCLKKQMPATKLASAVKASRAASVAARKAVI